MTMEVHNSDLTVIKNRMYFVIKSNPGITIDFVSRTLNVPLNVAHKALSELVASGHILNKSGLRIGKRMG